MPRAHDGIILTEYSSQRIKKHPLVGFTARSSSGSPHNIVTRVFGPLLGVNEDPVTGSYHCTLAPYWSTRLPGFKAGQEIVGVQGGNRKGEIRSVWLEDEERVLLRGSAVQGKSCYWHQWFALLY